MKQYTEIEHLTIYNEGNALIQQCISDHITSYSLDQCLHPQLLNKLKMMHDVLQLEIYHSIAIGSLCNHSLAIVVYRCRKTIVRSFKENLLNPLFLI